MLPREHRQRLVLVPEHLDEHDVPDLEHVGVVHVHQVRRVAPADAVIVQLAARAARARVAHLPEVVLHVPLDHPVCREERQPQVARLLVGRHHAAEVLVALTVGRVEAVRRELVHDSEELPRPRDALLLEVGRERPVAEHLEEGVVVDVLAHVVEVVVLAARADALRRVGRALELRERGGRVDHAHEDGLELVHARVVEEERGVVERHDAARGVVRVPAIVGDLLLRLEELDEGRAHFRRRPLEGHARCAAVRREKFRIGGFERTARLGRRSNTPATPTWSCVPLTPALP
mmetsp:Transcript_57753/g.137441  ORF Transcript_57753/g.137441 Transcript_57753/m.137441 type:complete len:290 (+) Transcript_57753:2218-3087(+)